MEDSFIMMEAGPISEEGALKFVFDISRVDSEDDEFTAEFLDGSTAELNIGLATIDGNYAFIGKDEGHPFEVWDEKNSEDSGLKDISESSDLKDVACETSD